MFKTRPMLSMQTCDLWPSKYVITEMYGTHKIRNAGLQSKESGDLFEDFNKQKIA